MPVELSDIAPLPGPCQQKVRKKLLKHRVHALRAEGLSYSAIAREVGVHRVTVKSWLQDEPPSLDESELLVSQEQTDLPPPVPWGDWKQVRQIREALREHRFLLLRRPESLDADAQEQLDSLLNSPVGPALKVARSFFGIGTNSGMMKTSVADRLKTLRRVMKPGGPIRPIVLFSSSGKLKNE